LSDEKSIRKMLDEIIRSPVPLGPTFIRPLSYFAEFSDRVHMGIGETIREHLHPTLLDILDHYERTMGWIRANPGVSHLVEAIRHLYIFPHPDGTESSFVVNLEANLKGFLNYLQDFRLETLCHKAFLVGPKGIGKTYFLNYVLNLYSTDLSVEKIFWLRVDGSKVYREGSDPLTYLYTHWTCPGKMDTLLRRGLT
jgi:hypothetical protein